MNDPLFVASKQKQSGSKAIQHCSTEESKGNAVLGKLPLIKKCQSLTKTTTVSVFGSIFAGYIEEQNKYKNNEASPMNNHPGVAMLLNFWKELIPLVYPHNVKQGKKPVVDTCYGKILGLFYKMTHNYSPLDLSFSGGKLLAEDYILTALLALQQTNNLAISTLSSLELDPNLPPIDIIFTNLCTLNDFFFILADLKCNIILPEKQLLLLQDIIKLPFQFLCSKVQNNTQLLHSLQQQKRNNISKYFYYSMQSIIVLAIFGEPTSMTKSKYEFILDRFKLTFGSLSQSVNCEQIFRDELNFESKFLISKNKYVINSYAFKRLSFLIQNEKCLGEQKIQFSLKYVLTYYNYKILKLITQRSQFSYNEHLFSALSPLISRNSLVLSSLLTQKDNIMSIMLLLNESVYIIKTYIINITFFYEHLDPLQRQSKYDTMKDIIFDCFSACLKLGLYKMPTNVEEAKILSITHPNDLLGMIFKSLLLFNKYLGKNQKHEKDIVHNLNVLIISIMSRQIQTEDNIYYHIYRLYMLQFLQSWEPKILMERYSKYSEEMSRFLSNFVEDQKYDNEIIEVINANIQKIALEIYIQMAMIDCAPAIENTVSLLADSFTKEKKLRQCFYILVCIFLRKRIHQDTFLNLLSWNIEQTKNLFGEIDCEREAKMFLEKDGMGIMLKNFKKSIAAYKQTKQDLNKYQIGKKTDPQNSLIGMSEVDVFIFKGYSESLENTIHTYKSLLNMTSWFICTFHQIPYIANQFLGNLDQFNIFIDGIFIWKQGRVLIHDLFEILNHQCEKIKEREDYIQKFVGVVIGLLNPLNSSPIKDTIKKSVARHVIQLLTDNLKQNVLIR